MENKEFNIELKNPRKPGRETKSSTAICPECGKPMCPKCNRHNVTQLSGI